MDFVKDALLINAYWFSFIAIGYVLLSLARRWKVVPDEAQKGIALLLSQNVLIVSFVSFATALVVMGLVTLIGYLFVLPIAVLTTWYVILLGVSALFMADRLFRSLFKKFDIDVFRLKGQTVLAKLIFVLFIVFIIVDYILAIEAKSHAALGSDTYVHLSRIVAILSQGMTIESGFFRDIPEVGYHVNLIYALYAVPAQLFSLSPSVVWEHSYSFFRFMQWTAIFSLAWYACTHWIKERAYALLGASLAGLFAVAYFTEAFFIAVYPNQIVNMWLILLILALSQYEYRHKIAAIPAFMAAFLIAMTHPTYSLMAGIFVGLIFIIKWLLQRKELTGKALTSTLKVYGGLILVLFVSPIRSALFPNHMSEKGFTLMAFPTIDLGPLAIKQPQLFYHGAIGTVIFVLSIIGFFFLLYKLWSQKRQWAVIFAAIAFFPLMVYVPFTFSVLEAVLPLWFIDRFTAINVINYIAAPIGVYAVVATAQALARRNSGVPGWITAKKTGVIMATVIIVLLSAYYMSYAPSRVMKYREQNQHYYSFMDRTYAQFKDILTDEKMVVAHQGDSYFLASILPIDVVGIEEGHTTPSADAVNRSLCQKYVIDSLRYTDLKAVDADYVVLSTYELQFKREKVLADNSPYLKRVASTNDFIVYQFLPDNATADQKAQKPYEPCLTFQKVEQE